MLLYFYMRILHAPYLLITRNLCSKTKKNESILISTFRSDSMRLKTPQKACIYVRNCTNPYALLSSMHDCLSTYLHVLTYPRIKVICDHLFLYATEHVNTSLYLAIGTSCEGTYIPHVINKWMNFFVST